MSSLRDRSEYCEPLIAEVETSHASGVFVADPRLRVEEVYQACDDTIGHARIAVRLDAEYDAYDARRRYHPDLRVRVRMSNRVIFEGHPTRQAAGWDGRPDREKDFFELTVEHVCGRLRKSKEARIYGRYVRNGEIEDGLLADPDKYAGRSVLMTALPCVFNPEGRPNCAATPLSVVGLDGVRRSVPVFTYDSDPNAIAWTGRAAMQYLAWFYLPKLSPVDAGCLFMMNEDAGDELYGLSCEGGNIVDALAVVAKACGMHISAETRDEAGCVRTSLRAWSGRRAEIKWLHLARAGHDAIETASDNDTYRAEIEWDDRPVINTVAVLGDVKKYEVTLPLVPGWLPESGLDDVPPESRDLAKATALTPGQVADLGPDAESSEWYRRYHRDGSEYAYGAAVARRWVLNEDGRYDAAHYDRNAPFDEYTPFDFSSVMNSKIVGSGAWMRRPRRLLPPLTVTAAGMFYPVYLEISFDGGATWERWRRSVSVLDGEAGVLINVANPTEVSPAWTEPEAQNMWYALVDQTFRVRVTAVIESDERLIHETSPGLVDAPTLDVHGTVMQQLSRFALHSRSGTTNVLTGKYPAESALERDDRAVIARYAESLALSMQERTVRALPAIPWLDETIAVGDRVAGVHGRELSFAATTTDAGRYPVVVAKRYRCGEQGWETEFTLER